MLRCERTNCSSPQESLFVSALPIPLGTLTRRYCRKHGRDHAEELVDNPYVETFRAISLLPHVTIFKELADAIS